MFKTIRTSKVTKVIVYYLVVMIFLEIVQPMNMYALTSGPKQPEFTAFTPISTSDMVSLTSGDFNYNIPIMDVGGYPLNLAYDSGVTMDQEATWVGLGWNLNVGQITRDVRGLPDDFRGDVMNYQNNMKDNITIGTNFNVSPALFGNDTPFNLGLGVEYNNYNGITFKPSVGLSYNIAGIGQVGVNLSGSVDEGASLTPSIGLSTKLSQNFSGSIGLSAGLSSRKGLENMSMSVSTSASQANKSQYKEGMDKYVEGSSNIGSHSTGGSSIGGSLSFNSQSYTPTKRIGYDNTNKTFNATLGGEVFGVEGQVRISGYGSVQSINESYKNRNVSAFGYENTQYKNDLEGVLDFNREKEQVISKSTNALPVTNYTYDIYNIQGQGVSGMFRPIRSQVTYLYNDYVSDHGSSQNFGAEIGLGNLVHGGANFNDTPTNSRTGLWLNSNYALSAFSESNTDTKKNPLYEPVVFKLVGEMDVDNEIGLYNNRINNTSPLRIKLGAEEINPSALPVYMVKPNVNSASTTYTGLNVNTKIKREKRVSTNQPLQKVTANEADNLFVYKNQFAKDYHTAGIKVLQNNGTTYVYGKSVYNTSKIEATFDVSGSSGDNVTGEVSYNGSLGGNNNNHSDKFENRITTPAYAHTFLITSVLSADYEDISNNGPTDDDLGGYTKFHYTEKGNANYVENYKWRVPYRQNTASYNEGLKCSSKDQKGNYIYGVKELSYLRIIETKTHVAFVDLEDRKDAMGVIAENGGMGSQAMKCIKSIRLFSKPELLANNITIEYASNIQNTISVSPIKTAHFDYDYSLCDGIPSSISNEGKLTLRKLYFTYRNSKMGKFTPYVFNYSQFENGTDVANKPYNIKSFDIWGNYKANLTGGLSTTDFPFVEQNQQIADINTGMWVLKSVQLPSGGTIKITTESDDYKYVQNKKAMEMFKVIGAGSTATPIANNKLYSNGSHNKYIYVQTNDPTLNNAYEFKNKYLLDNFNKPIYFKFLLKMHGSNKDYVSGYFEIENNPSTPIQVNNGVASIPLKFLRKDGGAYGSDLVNPITKAGWGFGRTYLNRFVYGGGEETSSSFISIVKGLVSSIASMSEIFTGPNHALQLRGCADRFDETKSWIRLENPDGRKLGGGLRVKKIELSDNWDVMNSVEGNTIYEEMYGQDYSYSLPDNTSSGVASFEPNASQENPFVEPFYGYDNQNYAERIGAPRENNYIEKPFGENFFPSPRVTYSRVTVSNLEKNDNGTKVVKKHATGKVITEHYTTKDFPTIVDITDIDVKIYDYKSPLWNMLSVYAESHLTASQGFTIETNDMDGKVKSQKVFAVGQNSPISRVDYNYNVDANGKLSSEFTTINEKGKIEKNLLGINYDVINDFNESISTTRSMGYDGNLASFIFPSIPPLPIFVPMVIPRQAFNETQLRTATTTKTIHKTGVLVETVAYDLGSRVATKNLAWDAQSGQVLLTQTTNEFDDNYYSLNYPAYWHYKNMGKAADNINMQSIIKSLNVVDNIHYFKIDHTAVTNDIDTYLKIGDEIVISSLAPTSIHHKLWVVGYNTAGTGVKLMDKLGSLVENDGNQFTTGLSFKVVRSGNRNMQMASMASVTLMKNPIATGTVVNYGGFINDATVAYNVPGHTGDKKIVNASAIEYSDEWNSQCENDLPNEQGLINVMTGTPSAVNPFLYNLKGDWRPIKSYAYLTGRNNFTNTNRRKTGYFNKFNPFYKATTPSNNWIIDSTNWTFASRVTKYSPYGVELENKDALNRYSSAQYGYKYTLPVAVSSNAQYREIGFDGFEDYDPFDINNGVPSFLKPHFGFSQDVYTGDRGASITDQKSHTGNNSIAIRSRSSVKFTRKVDGCAPDPVDLKTNKKKSKSNNSLIKKSK